MEKVNQKPPVLFLIISNLIPIAGVLFYDWEINVILFTYWLETLIIGFYNLLKLGLSTAPLPKENELRINGKPFEGTRGKFKLYTIAFFILHFGLFCTLQGFFLFSIISGDLASYDPYTSNILIQIGEKSYGIVNKNYDYILPGLFAGLALFLSHGFSFFYNFFIHDEQSKRPMLSYFYAPYPRILITQVVVIIGSMILVETGTQLAILILLIFLKIIIDVFAHDISHKFKSKEPPVSLEQNIIEK